MRRLPDRIALAGYAGAGKDEAAKALLELGYTRHNFGDIIKRQVNNLIRAHFGFSAFTEDRAQKPKIRRTLEAWGEDNYDAILAEYMGPTLPSMCVNTRLVRTREAERWRGIGGVIIEICRPPFKAATDWERERFMELTGGGWIDGCVVNDGTTDMLRANLLNVLEARMEAA